MFWDKVAFVYDLFANICNKKVHLELQQHIERMICPSDVVLECACGKYHIPIEKGQKSKKQENNHLYSQYKWLQIKLTTKANRLNGQLSITIISYLLDL